MNTSYSNTRNSNKFASIAEIIESSSELDASAKEQYIRNVEKILTDNKVNIMLAGATGAGKSSTINALFNIQQAKVGYGTDPETYEIQKFTLNNITLWDTPGFGDSPDQDRKTAVMIRNLLRRSNDAGKPLIDLVLVVVDGSSRDMMSTFELVTKVIEPNARYRDSIVIGINQTDVAMKGRHWDREKRKPETQLVEFMNEKVRSVKERISSSCGIDANVMYYSATEKYNVLKLLCFILDNLPEEEKILNVVEQMNPEMEIWENHDDETEDMMSTVAGKIKGVVTGAVKGAAIGSKIATKFGVPPVIGTILGGIAGGLFGLFS
ncbi:MAG: 50S ribosome-binding GTPase [Succinivibrionaceae bacterium]|nr:50S ribosome-binding GTPase [Succinivibrionaceae bacterium]